MAENQSKKIYSEIIIIFIWGLSSIISIFLSRFNYIISFYWFFSPGIIIAFYVFKIEKILSRISLGAIISLSYHAIIYSIITTFVSIEMFVLPTEIIYTILACIVGIVMIFYNKHSIQKLEMNLSEIDKNSEMNLSKKKFSVNRIDIIAITTIITFYALVVFLNSLYIVPPSSGDNINMIIRTYEVVIGKLPLSNWEDPPGRYMYLSPIFILSKLSTKIMMINPMVSFTLFIGYLATPIIFYSLVCEIFNRRIGVFSLLTKLFFSHLFFKNIFDFFFNSFYHYVFSEAILLGLFLIGVLFYKKSSSRYAITIGFFLANLFLAQIFMFAIGTLFVGSVGLLRIKKINYKIIIGFFAALISSFIPMITFFIRFWDNYLAHDLTKRTETYFQFINNRIPSWITILLIILSFWIFLNRNINTSFFNEGNKTKIIVSIVTGLIFSISYTFKYEPINIISLLPITLFFSYYSISSILNLKINKILRGLLIFPFLFPFISLIISVSYKNIISLDQSISPLIVIFSILIAIKIIGILKQSTKDSFKQIFNKFIRNDSFLLYFIITSTVSLLYTILLLSKNVMVIHIVLIMNIPIAILIGHTLDKIFRNSFHCNNTANRIKSFIEIIKRKRYSYEALRIFSIIIIIGLFNFSSFTIHKEWWISNQTFSNEIVGETAILGEGLTIGLIGADSSWMNEFFYNGTAYSFVIANNLTYDILLNENAINSSFYNSLEKYSFDILIFDSNSNAIEPYLFNELYDIVDNDKVNFNKTKDSNNLTIFEILV